MRVGTHAWACSVACSEVGKAARGRCSARRRSGAQLFWRRVADLPVAGPRSYHPADTLSISGTWRVHDRWASGGAASGSTEGGHSSTTRWRSGLGRERTTKRIGTVRDVVSSADLVEMSEAYRSGGYARVRTEGAESALAWFYLAVLAYGEGEFRDATTFAAAAAEREPESVVFGEAARWLDRPTATRVEGVYERGDAFAAFARGGGNVALYAATSERLRQAYAEHDSLALLDIGVGDGAALLPALSDRVGHVDLVEPSESLLAVTTAALAARGISHRAFCSTLEEFVADAPVAGTWDLAQATFALQPIRPAERQVALSWLAEHAARLVLVEFDVPRFDDLCAPARVQDAVERYSLGLAEYVEDRELVGQGFLMPVLFGYFDGTTARTNYEQPIGGWVEEVRTAGFAHVGAEHLHRYWWADAYFVDARTETEARS